MNWIPSGDRTLYIFGLGGKLILFNLTVYDFSLFIIPNIYVFTSALLYFIRRFSVLFMENEFSLLYDFRLYKVEAAYAFRLPTRALVLFKDVRGCIGDQHAHTGSSLYAWHIVRKLHTLSIPSYRRVPSTPIVYFITSCPVNSFTNVLLFAANPISLSKETDWFGTRWNWIKLLSRPPSWIERNNHEIIWFCRIRSRF